ncbi:hypothetical protein GCM10020331_021260 [Ectobacillus funiculus]
MASRLESLTDGLGQSVEGLQEVSKGLGSAQDYLGKLTNNTDPEMSGFFMYQVRRLKAATSSKYLTVTYQLIKKRLQSLK